MNLLLKGRNYLRLLEKKLKRSQSELNSINKQIALVSEKIESISTRIDTLDIQAGLFDQNMEFTREDFFDNRRQKTIVLTEISLLKYQIETLDGDLQQLKHNRNISVRRVMDFNIKCEKFQKYLTGLRYNRSLKSETSRENEVEELSVHGGIRI
ncbi:hypothetical protein QVN42_16145 [Yersinia nurmii]|uniref:Flagellar biosynthesis protein FlgN n=1 Tax=Yersinia nurmii TaxID=685706 RepID=A0AAW7K4B1_9GAMM|nr:hypothetical protein [Yersinia nurmii]MDN0088886.1 hypothetical protein [Yersinia nurmii]